MLSPHPSFRFFFNDTATSEIYTLSLHDALPIFADRQPFDVRGADAFDRDDLLDADADRGAAVLRRRHARHQDRKSIRLNSSHPSISYAVFCLKKKTIKFLTVNSVKITVSVHGIY